MSMVARRLSATIAPAGGGGSYTDLILDDSPTHYWKMEEASGDITDEVGSVTATQISTPSYEQTGIDGFGIYFGNTGTDAFRSSVNLFSPASGAWGVEAWFNTSDTTSAVRFVIYQSPFGYLELRTDGKAEVYIGGSITGATDLRDGNWHHIMAGSDSTDGMALWVDGSEVGTKAHGTRSGTPIHIGGGGGFGGSNGPMLGTLDEVAFYDYRPTTSMASARYNFF